MYIALSFGIASDVSTHFLDHLETTANRLLSLRERVIQLINSAQNVDLNESLHILEAVDILDERIVRAEQGRSDISGNGEGLTERSNGALATDNKVSDKNVIKSILHSETKDQEEGKLQESKSSLGQHLPIVPRRLLMKDLWNPRGTTLHKKDVDGKSSGEDENNHKRSLDYSKLKKPFQSLRDENQGTGRDLVLTEKKADTEKDVSISLD
jgi:hypothetical protein